MTTGNTTETQIPEDKLISNTFWWRLWYKCRSLQYVSENISHGTFLNSIANFRLEGEFSEFLEGEINRIIGHYS